MRSLRLPLLCLCLLLSACNAPGPDPAWVQIYDPDRAAPGYNLILFQRRTPTLIDMNGNAVHRWDTEAATRARLLPDGRLLVIGADGVVRELDWDGATTWEFRLPGEDFPHHDLLSLRSGNRLVLAHDDVEHLDYLVEVDDAGDVVWEWRARDHLVADLSRARELRSGRDSNLTHINSIHELPPNRWFDGGDLRFRPGNILISARNLNTLYLIDKATGDVVWRYDQGLDHQHEAAMVPPGIPGAGNILFFNNGLEDLYVYRRSAVIEIDPVAQVVVWSYRAPHFFSSTSSTQQILENGNVLVTSSRGGRAFEVRRDGAIVWQWVPPYLPMREHRYPYDYCPQLAALQRPRPRRVEGGERHHVDRDLYDFLVGLPARKSTIDGKERRLLPAANVCRELLLPDRPRLRIGWGFETEPGAAADAAAGVTARVRLIPVAREVPDHQDSSQERRSEPEQLAPPRVLFERDLRRGEPGGAAMESIVEQQIDLSGHAFEPVNLCFEATAQNGGPPDAAFFWARPVIQSEAVPRARAGGEPVDAEQSALRAKHLRALGYVD